MRVYFHDVGQGTCGVIKSEDDEVIVIDTGLRLGPLRCLLHHLSVKTVTLLVVSHGDEDHWGGAPALLTDTTLEIDAVCFNNGHKTLRTPFWNKVKHDIRKGRFVPGKNLFSLVCQDKPRELWKSNDGTAVLEILSPTPEEEIYSHAREDANAASGVLRLKKGRHCVVFSGDSHIDQWRTIRKCRNYRPQHCDVLSVPHHAGIIWNKSVPAHQIETQLTEMYRDFVTPEYAVVSVGTSNKFDHPRTNVIRALRWSGATVLCTQVTPKCCGFRDDNVELIRSSPVMTILSSYGGASSPSRQHTKEGRSKNVACAGTVVADLSTGTMIIERLDEHQRGLLASTVMTPQCVKWSRALPSSRP